MRLSGSESAENFILAPKRLDRLSGFSKAARARHKALRHKPMISTERKPAPITTGSFFRCGFLVSFP
jgi:hypothetical protein